MGNVKITVEVEAEKYKALQQFGSKKNLNIEKELADTFEKLYQKVVPAPVKEYIGSEAQK